MICSELMNIQNGKSDPTVTTGRIKMQARVMKAIKKPLI